MIRRIPILILVALLLWAAAAREPSPAPAAGVLRLHILANSDSETDQAVKLRVRDALVPLFETASSYEDARACQRVLTAEGASYGAQLRLGVSDFPDRTYGGIRFPAGAYDALEVVLGDGAGHNWWCVLFPPLCVVTADGGAAQPTEIARSAGTVRFESDILAFLRRRFGARAGEP